MCIRDREKVFSVVGEEKKQAEPAKPERPAPKPQPQETFEEILRKMRALNDEIADETVSHDIDRIGELTSNIFGIVRAHPERREEVRKFMEMCIRDRANCLLIAAGGRGETSLKDRFQIITRHGII